MSSATASSGGMEPREFEAQLKALSRAVNEKDRGVSTAVSILLKLQKEKPSEDLLRATKAGIYVARLRANPSREVASAASECITRWKSIVNNSKSKKSEVRAKAASKDSTPSATSSKATAAPSAPFKGDTEKRRFDSDGASINITQCEIRNRCVGLLYNGLAYRSTESVLRVTEVAGKVEAAIYAAHGSNSGSPEYKARVRSLFQNLKNKSNPDLGRNVMNGTITPEVFAKMTAEEMKSQSQRETERKLEEENMKRAQAPMEQKSVSDAWKCSKCGARKTSYTQAQTRAADEPMTTFCECMNCGHRWKFS